MKYFVWITQLSAATISLPFYSKGFWKLALIGFLCFWASTAFKACQVDHGGDPSSDYYRMFPIDHRVHKRGYKPNGLQTLQRPMHPVQNNR